MTLFPSLVGVKCQECKAADATVFFHSRKRRIDELRFQAFCAACAQARATMEA